MRGLADGVLARPEPVREVLVDDEHRRGLAAVVLAERPAFEHGNPHRCEVPRCHDVVAYAHVLVRCGLVAGNLHASIGVAQAQRHVATEAHGLDARK